MADVPKQDGTAPGTAPAVAAAATSAPAKPAKPPNPVFRMMGLPNLPRKLPSRNWMIFWTVIVSFTAAKLYDNRQRKAVQKKWCDLVAHVAQEKLPVTQLPRKLTVFLAAPPGDGIGPSRTYFKQYVKPVLVAAAMDYEVIEGRKEGDVRYGTAENIRRLRRKKGEQGAVEPEMDGVMAVDLIRDRLWIQPEAGVRGDLVLGRHTWKEYIRGIHEGWLGPLDEPSEPPSQEPLHVPPPIELKADEPTEISTIHEASSTESETKPSEEKKEEEKKKPHPPPSYLPIQAYEASPLSAYTPVNLEPSQPIHQQHLLGFLKTPERIWNFLNRRKLTDEIGRQTAAIVLAQHRPYQSQESFASPSFPDDASPATRAPENDLMEDAPIKTNATYEQQSFLTEEEPYWHKSVRKPLKDGDERERVWLNDIVLDPKIAQRMRKFELDPEEEERANRIFAGQEQGRAVPVRDLTKEKPIIGSLDQDSMDT